jgi:DNA modification methylase
MTTLLWDGKYDEAGRKVAPPRIALPFQTVETVNESAADRDRNFEIFAAGKQAEWRNRLIWGDKKYVLPSLLEEFAGRVNLIYIDPPFATGGDFSFTATIPQPSDGDEDDEVSFIKAPSVIEQKAYRDTWGRGLDSYVKWFYDTSLLLRELLAEDGSLWVHLDYTVGQYAKVILDEVFGIDNFVNSITWKRSDAHSDIGQGAKHLGRISDCLLYYSRSVGAQTLNMEFTPLPQSTIDKWYRHVEPGTGRRFNKGDTSGPGGARKGNPVFEWKGVTRAWRFNKKRMQELEDAGLLVYSESGVAYLKRYLDESKGVPLQDIWDDIKMIRGIHGGSEALGYATQKPEALLQRIVRMSSNEGDLVLDCFCGSGTTAAVAEKLNRRWIGCDLGRFAIHTTRKRLLGIPNVRPFVVQNLGKYERQAWQEAEFGAAAQAQTVAYRSFILQLYRAQRVEGYVWLHGSRGGRMIHIGGVDAPVTMADVTSIVAEIRRAIGKGRDAPKRSAVDILGWDFAFELNQTARQKADLAGIDLRLIRIPREVLEKKAVEQGDIRFFELAALDVAVRKTGRSVTLTLKDFVIPLDDVPEDIQRAITRWEQWVDYWAVDWDNSDDTFHNEWQAYRTKRDQTLPKEVSHTYPVTGSYRVIIKVIDILGNDTTKAITIEVK